MTLSCSLLYVLMSFSGSSLGNGSDSFESDDKKNEDETIRRLDGDGGEAKRAHLIWIELEEPQETLEGLLSDLVREYLEQGDGKHERSSIAL